MEKKLISRFTTVGCRRASAAAVRLLPASLLLMVFGCAADLPITEPDSEGSDNELSMSGYIVALQGGASMTSRAGYEDIYGESTADCVDVYAHFDIKQGNNDFNDNRNLKDTVNGWNRIRGTLENSVNTPYGRDTYGRFPLKFTTDHGGSRHKRFSFLTVAYNHQYAGTFRVNRASKRDDCTLELLEQKKDVFEVPEIYYSNVKFPLNHVAGHDWEQHKDWGTITDNSFGGFGDRTFDVQLEGYLPRIVSQFNVTLTELPYDDIESIELVVNRLPSKIRLWATKCHHHADGGLYPINLEQVTQLSNCIQREVVVDRIENLRTPTATLSTFMFPSSVGFALKVLIHSNQYDLEKMEKDGYDDVELWPEEKRVFKTYEMKITPRSDTYITDYAGRYCIHTDNGSGGVANSDLAAGTPIKIYSAKQQQFFSISNIRVHIEGEYGSATGTDVSIEVEPSYERKHDITL